MKLIDYLPVLPEAVLVEGFYDGTHELAIDGDFVPIKISQAHRNHSNEFNWGYNGSGPAQTALAILLHFLPYPLALQWYQDFKFEVVSGFSAGRQTSFSETINLRAVMTDLEAKRANGS